MRIHRVRLENVRGVDACEVEFDTQGITVVAAPNESGKTTVVDAIRVALTEKQSTTKSHVRQMMPAGRDVGSLVEVELTAGEYHLTCRKRFNKQTEAVVEIHAPSPRQLAGDEAHDLLQEVLAEHVDMGLFDALWIEQGRDLDALALGSTSLADRLDAVAAGDPTGGDDLIARVDEHYADYFTQKTGRPKPALTELDERVAELEAGTAELRRRLDDVRAEAEELDEIERRLPGLERDLAETLEPALEQAVERVRHVQSVRQRRDTRLAEQKQADTQRVAAIEARDRRRGQLERLTTLEGELSELTARLEPTAKEVGELADRKWAAEQEVREAAEAVTWSRRRRDRARWTLDLLEARGTLDRLTGRHERARKIMEDTADAQSALDRLRLDEELLREIRDADARIRMLSARAQGTSPTVRLRAHAPLRGEIDGESFDLGEGEVLERTVRGRLRVHLEQLELEVIGGETPDDLAEQIDGARRALAELCDRAGVGDLEEAEHRALERRGHEEALRQRDALLERELEGMTISELADAVDAANARVDQLVARDDASGDPPEDEDLEAARSALADATDRADQAERAHDEAKAQLEVIASAHEAARERHAHDRTELDSGQRQLERDREVLEADRRVRCDDDLDSAVIEADAAHRDATSRLAEVDGELDQLDPERMELAEESARNARDAVLDRIAQLRQRRTELTVRLETIGAQGLGEELAATQAQLERAELDRRRQWQRAEAVRLLHAELHAARDEMHRAYRAPLRERIVRMAGLVFDAEVDVELDDELRIAMRTMDGVTLEWGQLSAGAREQLAILTALAAAQLAGDDGVPFVLDDALGYTDPQRLARLGALLGRTSGAQVIVLTCAPERFSSSGARTVALRTGGD